MSERENLLKAIRNLQKTQEAARKAANEAAEEAAKAKAKIIEEIKRKSRAR